ncbi:hypothetical protein [Lichenicoccus roseus]|uniref:hypothetical protein n=1 Tax=Lichenicoccus roseus TaxID=2683649 RepID=UPI001485C78E|nr:hypothetical protein [Lichenicoccus roseus]
MATPPADAVDGKLIEVPAATMDVVGDDNVTVVPVTAATVQPLAMPLPLTVIPTSTAPPPDWLTDAKVSVVPTVVCDVATFSEAMVRCRNLCDSTGAVDRFQKSSSASPLLEFHARRPPAASAGTV